MMSQDTLANNKRIAKNTLLLYIRMLFMMVISLFTSRVILNTLGVEDYGIQNVVGGVVAMFGFLNGSMTSATQRFITFALGKGDKDRLQIVFNTTFQIHSLIAVIILLLGETIGLWFLNNKMQLPADRMNAAFWVLQCSIVSTIVMILSVPYNACIIAHEKMSAFAYISVLEAILKLVIVYLLLVFSFDKLIIYAILTLIVQCIICFCYGYYCNRHFNETRFRQVRDKILFKEMTGFAVWSLWGNLSVVLFTQGLNMLLNVFFGPIVNAARAIAVQVQGVVQQFVGNFQMAINPQITKNYASGNLEQMHSLMFRSARFSFLLLFFISLPVILETEFILSTWLKIVPDDAVIFTQIMICISLIYTTSNPCIIANQATGKVKIYQMVVGGILLTILPISYIVLNLGAPAYSVFIVHFCIESLAQFARMYMLRKLINLPMWQYMKNIYLPIATTVVVAIIFPVMVHMQMENGWSRLIAVGFTCMFSVCVSSFLLGLTKSERAFFWDKGLRLLKVRL